MELQGRKTGATDGREERENDGRKKYKKIRLMMKSITNHGKQ